MWMNPPPPSFLDQSSRIEADLICSAQITRGIRRLTGHLRTPKAVICARQKRVSCARQKHANPFRYDPLGWGGNHHGHPLLPRGTTLYVAGRGTIMDILYFQGVRPFRLAWGELMDILCFQGVRPFRLGGEPSWTSFTSKGYDPLGWGAEPSWTSFTSKGYLYFQGVRPFRLGGEPSWTSRALLCSSVAGTTGCVWH